MTTRRRNLVLLGAAVAIAVATAFFLSPRLRERKAIEAIPDGAFLVITVDLVRLRASPLAREIASLSDVSDISRECGFDPLERARSVAIGVPEKPDGVFGVAITTDLTEAELVPCAERVMGARSATPHVVQRGSWTEIEQEGILTQATRAKIAHRDGSPLLVARGDYLATMQAALDGSSKRAVADERGEVSSAHTGLRKVALDHAHGEALLVATAILPKSVRDKLKDTDASQDSADRRATMSAVLSVRAVSFAVTAHGDSLDVFAELDCETAAACATVRDFIDRKRAEIASKPAARLVGIGGLLDAVRLEARGTALDVSLSAPESELARAARAAWGAAFSPETATPLRTGRDGGSEPGFSPRR